MSELGRTVKLIAALAGLLALPQALTAGQSLTLEWDPSADLSVTGYKVYYQQAGSTNVVTADAGGNTVFTLAGLAEAGTYRFYVTAYNSAGLESDPSNTVEYTVPLGRLASVLTSDAEGRPLLKLFSHAVAGQRVALESSTNLVDWAVLATAAPGQPLVYDVVPGEAKRFYRCVCVP